MKELSEYKEEIRRQVEQKKRKNTFRKRMLIAVAIIGVLCLALGGWVSGCYRCTASVPLQTALRTAKVNASEIFVGMSKKEYNEAIPASNRCRCGSYDAFYSKDGKMVVALLEWNETAETEKVLEVYSFDPPAQLAPNEFFEGLEDKNLTVPELIQTAGLPFGTLTSGMRTEAFLSAEGTVYSVYLYPLDHPCRYGLAKSALCHGVIQNWETKDLLTRLKQIQTADLSTEERNQKLSRFFSDFADRFAKTEDYRKKEKYTLLLGMLMGNGTYSSYDEVLSVIRKLAETYAAADNQN